MNHVIRRQGDVHHLSHKDLAPGERNGTVILVSVSGISRITVGVPHMKKLLICLLLTLNGCDKLITDSDVDDLTDSKGSKGNSHTAVDSVESVSGSRVLYS